MVLDFSNKLLFKGHCFYFKAKRVLIEMKSKLSLFNELHLTTKEEVLFELDEYSNSLREEDGYSIQKINSLKLFIKKFSDEINRRSLPELNKWWNYHYMITGNGAELRMCYCSSIEYRYDGEDVEEESEGESFTLINLSADYMDSQSFFKKYDIEFSKVEDLIRAGRIQYVVYKSGKWLISDLQDRPSSCFVPVFISLPSTDDLNHLAMMFPFLDNCLFLDIHPVDTNESFVVTLRYKKGVNNTIYMDKDEVGEFLLSLYKTTGVTVHAYSDMLYKPFPKKEDIANNNEIDTVIKYDHKGNRAGVHFGCIIVTKGVHKGRIGFYDDEDYNRCIVYFGDPYLTNNYYRIPRSYLSNQISSEELFNRLEWLYKRNFDAVGHERHYEYLLELFFCYSIFNQRFIDAVYKSPVGDSPMVFISHATEDLSLAEMIAIDLKDSGYEFFLDAYSINMGKSIPRKISEGLEKSCALIILVSDAYNKSVFCNDEWEAFYLKYSREKPDSILPIMIGDAQPPALLGAKKYERFTGHNYRKILDAMLVSLHEITLIKERTPRQGKRSIKN